MTELGVGVVRPLPGNGLIAHVGGLLLVCDAADAVAEELLAAVQETAAAGGDGRALARRAAQILARSMTAEPIACALAGRAGGGIAVLVSGDAQASITGPGTDVRLDGKDALTWTDRLVPGPVDFVELRLPDAGTPIGRARLDAGVIPGGGVTCDFGQGGGPMAGMSAEPARGPRGVMTSEPSPGPAMAREPSGPPAMESAQARSEAASMGHAPFMSGPPAAEAPRHPIEPPPLPVIPPPPPVTHEPPADPSPAPMGHYEQSPALVTDPDMAAMEPPGAAQGEAPDFESFLLIDGAEEQPGAADPLMEPTEAGPAPEPLSRPMVYGVDCKNDHFNDPRVPYCAVCGIALVQRTLVPYKGERPPLGVLLLDDGLTLRLDSDYLLGRDPERAPEVTSGEARPARVTSPDGSVSRRHLRVRLDGWDVNLIDLGSVNGTQVQPPGDPNFYDIPPNEPVPILPGTTVRVGVSRTMRYESHRKG
ncbi:FHA domain-containing protein [Sphaerisporangium perillae]|uniref:FHA domain-containing protein n=1 Tax=Sphaerisporangium perillae TaxID=2935860 RepID=UPI00200D6B1F|nr:FHA domain-containing protein [Sphaerisporangium perillae]